MAAAELNFSGTIRPQRNQSLPTSIDIHVELLKILGIVSIDQSVTIFGVLVQVVSGNNVQ